MQYIKKQNKPPENWDSYFEKYIDGTEPVRSFDYGKDYGSLRQLSTVLELLINEQHGLCAYCQQKIKKENASIEHVFAKEFNKELSTNYYNLVAVCKNPPKDKQNRSHCDKERGSALLTPIIFYADSQVEATKNNSYFVAYSDGLIEAKPQLKSAIKKQVEAFIELLNLNNSILKESRAKDVLDGLTSIFAAIPNDNPTKKNFWQAQFERILRDEKRPFRQFLLIYIFGKLRRN